MRKIQILANYLDKAKISQVLLYLRGRLFSELTILAYHRILDVPDPDAYPFDIDTVDADLKNFQWQMEFIKRHFTPISTAQLCDHLDAGEPLPPRPIVITFDDGFDDNYHNAYPILKSLKIPATIFLAVDHIDTENPFWFEWLAFMTYSVDTEYFEVPVLGVKQKVGKDVKDRRDLYNFCVEKMKHVKNSTRLEALDQIKSRYGDLFVSSGKQVQALCRPLTWEQCREMHKNNISFGSHSVTHPILSMLNQQELEYELIESKKMVEEKIGQSVKVLAFPNGQEGDYNDNILETAFSNGYSLCLSYIHGRDKIAKLNSRVLKRMHIGPKNDKSIFIFALGAPVLKL